MTTIAIIDIIGIPYDGTTVFNQGLGGSESAVTLISRQLADLGFDVTVFNNCEMDHAQPGIYDGVKYRPLRYLSGDHDFDIVISSRTVIPFVDPRDYAKLKDIRALPFKDMQLYDRILSRAKMRVLWMHDTFCLGDDLIEELAVSNRITDIFTLSDWHLTYIANCHHGRRRNFEVLKSKLFITRNGVHVWNKEVDIKSKDRDLFVYNASVTKGMIPLVEKIWPFVRKYIPNAKLKVIGGYYRFSTNSQPDEQEKRWREMAANPDLAALGIEFTGIIPQKDIADILTKANFMIYPSAFPETFGISTMESICYNTPVVTCRFGALEEIAIENACYLIDYAIEPNSLFPDIDVPRQIEQFVKTVIEAYRNPYLHQQKQYYCNIIKDIVGWDSVALQWKQHFYKKLDLYLPIDQYRSVTKINRRWHKITNRRYHNTVELSDYKQNREREIIVISPFYNCRDYITRCIESVAAQDYDNYRHILIDDCSTDDTVEIVAEFIDNLPENLRYKFELCVNAENHGAVRNQIVTMRSIANDDAIIMLLDGDDSLVNDNTIFDYFNTVYADGAEFTYGSCWSMVDNIPLISQPYPDSVRKNRGYRQHHFNWMLPYTHLRTFKKKLINDLSDDLFKDKNGNWYKAGGDGAVFYAMIEAADPDRVRCLQDIVYNYNDTNPLNDYKINGELQNKNAEEIRNKMQRLPINPTVQQILAQNDTPIPQIENKILDTVEPKKKILIAIPTAKNIEAETFKAIYDLEIPEGYQTTFQYFYGYNIDQVRNLIADWVVKGYDYLFSVDSDIAFPRNTLKRLLSHDKDVVSGLYIQRKPGQHTLEIYEANDHGGVSNIPYGKLKGRNLVEVQGCGFGCVLVKAEVMRSIGYPQFKYYSALDHKNTISEDVDFCKKALAKGFRIWADTSVKCRHIGQGVFEIDENIAVIPDDKQTRLRILGQQRLIPKAHVDYLKSMKTQGISPKVIYDVGACVLHWTTEAKEIWTEAEIVAFEAMDSAEFLYKEAGMRYHIGALSDETGREVDFYQNDQHPGGNSYYLENPSVNPQAPAYFNESHRRKMKTVTLDAIMRLKQLPPPDLLKLDVQGAELDVLKGALECLTSASHVILELQKVEYNQGAPLKDTVIEWMQQQGFQCLGMFSDQGPDGDYHFSRL
jgi:FkbM family methyltransferase